MDAKAGADVDETALDLGVGWGDLRGPFKVGDSGANFERGHNAPDRMEGWGRAWTILSLTGNRGAGLMAVGLTYGWVLLLRGWGEPYKNNNQSHIQRIDGFKKCWGTEN